MHVTKEGTQTSIDDALLEKEDIPLDKRDDWEEVQNYIKAMQQAVLSLDSLSFSARLIRETHKILLQGVHGGNKQPGEFRNSQNWIGGSTLIDSFFKA